MSSAQPSAVGAGRQGGRWEWGPRTPPASRASALSDEEVPCRATWQHSSAAGPYLGGGAGHTPCCPHCSGDHLQGPKGGLTQQDSETQLWPPDLTTSHGEERTKARGRGQGQKPRGGSKGSCPAARGRCPASSVAALDAPAAGVKAPGQRAQHTHRHGHMARPEDGGDGSGQGQLRQAPETPWARRKGTSLFWTTEAGAPGQSARHGHRKSE